MCVPESCRGLAGVSPSVLSWEVPHAVQRALLVARTLRARSQLCCGDFLLPCYLHFPMCGIVSMKMKAVGVTGPDRQFSWSIGFHLLSDPSKELVTLRKLLLWPCMLADP